MFPNRGSFLLANERLRLSAPSHESFWPLPLALSFPTSNLHHSLPSTPHFIPEDGGRMVLRNVIHLNQEEHYLYLKGPTRRHVPKSVTKNFSLILHRTTEFISKNIVLHNNYSFPRISLMVLSSFVT
jgi:hypothetical protein